MKKICLRKAISAFPLFRCSSIGDTHEKVDIIPYIYDFFQITFGNGKKQVRDILTPHMPLLKNVALTSRDTLEEQASSSFPRADKIVQYTAST